MPKVTVIIPTYNRAYIVCEAIESVLAQTFDDFELIVVDDGSTDDTAERIAAIRDPRVRYIRQANAGVAAARNHGIAQARGDTIAFLDSDDLWRPDKLEGQVLFLSRHPEAGAVFCDGEGSDRQGRKFRSTARINPSMVNWLGGCREKESVIPAATLRLMLLRDVTIAMSALAIRASILADAPPFDPLLKSGEDWEWFLRLSENVNFGYIDEPLFVRRPQADATHAAFAKKEHELTFLGRERRRIPVTDREARRASRIGILEQARFGIWQAQAKGHTGLAITTALRALTITGSPEMLLRALWVCVPNRKAPQETLGAPKQS